MARGVRGGQRRLCELDERADGRSGPPVCGLLRAPRPRAKRGDGLWACPQAPGAIAMNRPPLPKSRVLVLIAGEICGRCLARELADRGEVAAGTSVVIIAPALVHSATAAWTDDIDAGIAEAERKVEASVPLLRRQGCTVVGKVGDSNPIRAIEDGLAEFAPDSVIVATHPAERMGLLEQELVDRLAHDGTGATRVVMTPDGDYPLTGDERRYAPGRSRKSGLQADDKRATATEH